MIILRWRVPGQGWRKNEAINACMTTGPYCAHYSSPKSSSSLIKIKCQFIQFFLSFFFFSKTYVSYFCHWSSPFSFPFLYELFLFHSSPLVHTESQRTFLKVSQKVFARWQQSFCTNYINMRMNIKFTTTVSFHISPIQFSLVAVTGEVVFMLFKLF